METAWSLRHATLRSTTDIHFKGDRNAAQQCYHVISAGTVMLQHVNSAQCVCKEKVIQFSNVTMETARELSCYSM